MVVETALVKHPSLAVGDVKLVVKQYPVTPFVSVALTVKVSCPLLGALTVTPEMIGAVVYGASPPPPPPPQADKTNTLMADMENDFKSMSRPDKKIKREEYQKILCISNQQISN